jgi:dsRNA-specific ribonuclease
VKKWDLFMRAKSDKVNAMDIEKIKHQIHLPPLESYDLIELALSHNSYINDNYSHHPVQRQKLITEWNRLAHLGDAIMNAAATDFIFRAFPDADKGVLSEKGKLLKERQGAVLYAKAVGLDQPRICNLGNCVDEKQKEGDLFGEMFEALMGALYLTSDRNFTLVREWFYDQCSVVIEDQLNKIH